MHCATSRKVPGSIPGGVTGDLFHGIRQSHVPGVHPASKNEYQDTPGGKDGRCVWLTTYHLQVTMSRNLWALTSQKSLGLLRYYSKEPCWYRHNEMLLRPQEMTRIFSLIGVVFVMRRVYSMPWIPFRNRCIGLDIFSKSIVWFLHITNSEH
jgi:hypothetical protein